MTNLDSCNLSLITMVMLPIRIVIAILLISQTAYTQTWEREDIRFSEIKRRAKELATTPYQAPDASRLPEWMTHLSYDQYRDIRFNPQQALWSDDKTAFRAMMFHPGYLYRETVTLNEITASHQQQIRLTDAFFNYGPLIKNHGDLPPDAGFAGFRLHHPLNNPNVFDELICFQGASYWRALGKNQRYGLSARGLAINTGVEGVSEEFPSFREFWIRKPEPDEQQVKIYALLDGPSYTGAYIFKINPGESTIVEVKAVLHVRKSVQRIGIAPISSMFWFGENSRRRFDDFRPEVHDSDGLSVRMGTGERIWRPTSNDGSSVGLSFFQMEKCAGFGLIQRDRRFSSYEDNEAAYHLRPSLWIEPTSEWGPGRVILMEIPTSNELSDNLVALWEPAQSPKAGDEILFSYRQHWTMDNNPAQADGYVVATRSGVHDWQPNQRTVIVEFSSDTFQQKSEIPVTGEVSTIGDNANKIKISDINTQFLSDKICRLSFQIHPASADSKLADCGPVELRCCLKRGEDYLTETWANRITP